MICCGRSGCTSKQPLRIIADGTGRSPIESKVFNEPGHTLVATVKPFNPDKKKLLEKTGVEVVELPGENGLVDLEALLRTVGQRGVISVLLEGGSELLGYAFDHKLVDKVLAFIAPIIIGGTDGRTAVGGDGVLTVQDAFNLDSVEVKKFADNVLVSGYVRTAAPISCSVE